MILTSLNNSDRQTLEPDTTQPPETSDAVAEPGMTLAFETPFYVEGLGGFIIEDQLLVTDDGYECMAEAPRGLFVAKL